VHFFTFNFCDRGRINTVMRGRPGLTFQLSPAQWELYVRHVIFRPALVSDVKLYIRRRTRSHVISALSHHSNCVRIRTLLRFDVFQIYQQSRWVCYVSVCVYLLFVRESEWVRAFVYNYTCSASKMCAHSLWSCEWKFIHFGITAAMLVKFGTRGFKNIRHIYHQVVEQLLLYFVW